jgi:putative polyhydroxyalkanoate system protein
VPLRERRLPTITVQRRHKLDHKKARAAADRIAKDLKKRFELDYEWDGDNVSFERAGVSGNMHVGKSIVRLDVQLSFLLTPLKGPIEQEISKEMDALFGQA